jgi:hypothetical protein
MAILLTMLRSRRFWRVFQSFESVGLWRVVVCGVSLRVSNRNGLWPQPYLQAPPRCHENRSTKTISLNHDFEVFGDAEPDFDLACVSEFLFCMLIRLIFLTVDCHQHHRHNDTSV